MSKTQPARMTVLRTEPLSPSMLRVVFGGEGFDEFSTRTNDFTDQYVKLVFLADGFDYPDPLDLDVVRDTMPRESWPVLRTYTVRWVNVEAREVAIDFVTHGDHGYAARWASRAEPGDVMHLRGPSGAYAPSPDADWHLFIGDEAGLPAISSALEALLPGSRAVAFIEVTGVGDELKLSTAADLQLQWLHRGDATPGTTSMLNDAVRQWRWPSGRVQVFMHGESALLKTLRPYLFEQGVARTDASISAYWRRGSTEEEFKRWKSEQDEAIIRPGASS